MARERTGTLNFRASTGSYRARLTVVGADGTTTRPWYSLGTADKALATKRLAALVAAQGRQVAEDTARVEPYALAWLDARRARGVAQVGSEAGWLTNHILPAPAPDKPSMGSLYLPDVRPLHVRAVLDAVAAKGLGRQSLVHVRSTMHLIFDQAWRDELIPENPVLKVKLPEVREVTKKREILTDDEIAALWRCDEVSIELRLLVLVARCEGGMRTRDCTAWTWEAIDRESFATCIVPRTKTGKPQRLEIPAVLRAPLRKWWEDAGSPSTGPVFPVTKGTRKGEARKAQGVSFADRLRRGLLAASVDRHELHHETEWSLPVDFHSCRRAFATALAETSIEPRAAMRLTGHSSTQAHERYVMERDETRRIPDVAIPRLVPRIVPQSSRPLGAVRISLMIPERDTRFELATLSLGS